MNVIMTMFLKAQEESHKRMEQYRRADRETALSREEAAAALQKKETAAALRREEAAL